MSTPDKSIDSRLLESAKCEFLKHGFIKAELKTICENANITTGAVYKRYKGKEELFCAVVGETADALNAFVKMRSETDFTKLSDEEIFDSWTMTYESMIPLFHMLYERHDCFVLLISKAAGTRYEDFSHEYVTKMSYAYVKFYEEAKRRGLAGAEVTREEFHVLISSALPFFAVYRIIKPLLDGKKLSVNDLAILIAIIFICELVYANMYTLGLKFSHISAYNTLKNIRISLQKKLEQMPVRRFLRRQKKRSVVNF